MVCEERLNSLQAMTGVGCSEFDGFHRAEHDQRSILPLCSRSRLYEKTTFY